MKDRILIILSLVTMGIGLVLSTFFYRYHGHIIPYKWFFFVLSCGIVWLGLRMFTYNISKSDAAFRKKNLARINRLKKNGNKISIPFGQIKLTGTSRSVEIQGFSTYESRGLDQLIGHEAPVKTKDLHYNTLYYKDEGGRTYASEMIEKDEITLQFLLEKKGQIDLYISPKNNNNYYLDVGFLMDN